MSIVNSPSSKEELVTTPGILQASAYHASLEEPDALTKRIADSIVRRTDGTFEVPVSLTYAGSKGADEWIKAAQDPDYLLREEELNLVEAFFGKLHVPVSEIVEFGPGDGFKAAEIIDRLTQDRLMYTAFDLNCELLAAARAMLNAKSAKTPRLDLRLQFFGSLDLEDARAIESAERPLPRDGLTVGMLLGQTLGNPTDEGRTIMLRNIQARLPENGLFIVGVALAPVDPKIIKKTLAAYQAPRQRRQLLTPFEHLRIADHGKLDIVWNVERHSVVGYFTFDRDVSVPGTELAFKRGDKAQVFNSHRFTETELVQTLTDTGFGDATVMKSESFPYALASARVVDEKEIT